MEQPVTQLPFKQKLFAPAQALPPDCGVQLLGSTPGWQARQGFAGSSVPDA